jgi:hypothetical protein
VDHQAHFVQEPSDKETDEWIQQIAKEWLTSKGNLEFVRVQQIESENNFKGLLHIRAKAGTGVDSYEKILRGRLAQSAEHGEFKDADLAPVPGDLQVSKLIGNRYQDSLKKIVEQDADVKRFCGFYVDRLREGVKQSGNDRTRIAKLSGDFKPYVQADVLGLEGIRYQVKKVRVHYSVNGAEYSSELTCVPISRKILAEPKTGICSITQTELPVDCLVQCQHSNKPGLAHLMVQSDSGLLALPNLISVCALSGAKLLPNESFTAADGTIAKKDLFTRDFFTGEMLLPSELAVSELSGNKGRKTRLVESAVSSRKAFPEETVICAQTNRVLLQDEAKKSTVTGKWFGLDQLVQSTLSEDRGTPDEMVACAITGRIALPGELGKCSVSGKLVCKERLVTSASTGNWLLPEEGDMTTTGQIAEREEIAKCSVTGEKLLLKDMTKCQVSGLLVKPAALAKSDFSERWALPNLMVPSAISGRCGLPDEMVECAKSGKKAHRSELGVCTISQKLVCPQFLVVSPVSQKKILPEEGVMTHDGKIVEREFAASCGESGEVVLKNQLARCEVTNKWVKSSLLSKSSVSGRQCLSRLMKTSKKSGMTGLPSEGDFCQVSGEWALASELEAQCPVTGKKALKSLFVNCAKSGLRVLPEATGRLSDGTYVLKRFLGKCEKTGKLVLKDNLARCQITGLLVDQSLLVKSDASGTVGLPEEMILTEEGQYGLPSEVSLCPWDGKPHLKIAFANCALTGFRAYWIHLNKDSELRDLRNLIDGSVVGEPVPATVCEKLALLAEFKNIANNQPTRIMSPSGKAYALAFTERAGWFKTKIQRAAAVIRTTPEGEVLRGKIYRLATG